MADTQNPAPEAGEQQQEAAVEDTTTEQAAAATTEEPSQGDGETQEEQDAVVDDKPADEGVVGDVDAVPAAADTGDDGDGQQQEEAAPAEEERQPTPVVEPPQDQIETEVSPEESQAEQDTACEQNGEEGQQPATEEEPAEEPAAEPAEEPAATQDEPEQTEEHAVTLSEEDMQRCKQYFCRKAVEGRLDLRGFKAVCRLMGEVLSHHDADQMFCDAQKDDNGTIDFDEFCCLYAKHSEEESARKAAMMSSINKLFPSNEPVELKKVKGLLMKMQRPDLDMRLVREKSDLNPADIHNLVRSMDTHGSGFVSKQEFVDTLCKHLEHC